VKNLFILLSIIWAATSFAQNLIENPSFEDDRGDQPAFWVPGSPEGPNPPNTTFEWEDEVARTGDRSVSIERDGEGVVAYWNQTLTDLEPNETYTLSTYARSEEGNVDFVLTVIFWIGMRPDMPPTVFEDQANDQWRRTSGAFTVPRNTDSTKIQLAFPGQEGKIYFDDVSLVVGDDELNPDAPSIYVSIVSHNEEPPLYPNFVDSVEVFQAFRSGVVNFANMLHEEGVKYNFQSDWNFLLAAVENDTGTESTNNKNLLRYLKEDLEFEVDPHAHETQYNYADVAHLIDQLEVDVSHTVGGYLAFPPEDAKIEYFHELLRGDVYDDFEWQAEILWGGATLGHENQDTINISGIWKPMDNEHFLTHDQGAPLPNIGGYISGWQGLDDLLDRAQDGDLQQGKIYTVTIFVPQLQMQSVMFMLNFRDQIRSYEDYTELELIHWVGLSEVVDIWHDEFDSEPNLFHFHHGHLSAPDDDAGPVAPVSFILYPAYPNPFNALTRIQYSIVQPSNVTLKVYDLSGRETATLVNATQMNGNYQVVWDASGMMSGIYFLSLNDGRFVRSEKVVLVR